MGVDKKAAAASPAAKPIQIDIKAFDKAKKNLTHVKDPEKAKKAPAPDKKAIEGMVALFTKHKGDLAALAKATKSSEKLMKAKPPKDAKDFAAKILAGAYVAA